MPPTTGNTLAPGYNSLNPTEARGTFDVSRYTEQEVQPELTPELTQAEVQPHFVEPTLEQLSAMAQSRAEPSLATAPSFRQEAIVQSKPVREGIENNAEMARREVAVDGAAVETVREAALPQIPTVTEEQRKAAQWN